MTINFVEKQEEVVIVEEDSESFTLDLDDFLLNNLQSAYFDIEGATPSITFFITDAEVPGTVKEHELGQLVYSTNNPGGFDVKV